ncbi:MAG: chemotaxis protein [Campylobacteraceae bacterium]|nr:chemotaxis protein [Campylobacteraceae bacterium]
MFKNLSTKTKLMFLPLIFVFIMAFMGSMYSHYNNIFQKAAEASFKTQLFVQLVLKGRISVYQFLRNPSTSKSDTVIDSFNILNIEVSKLKSKLTVKKNVVRSNYILKLSKEYLKYFSEFSTKRIEDVKNNKIKESKEVLIVLKKMVQIGLKLEREIDEISASAKSLEIKAISSLNTALITIALLATILFIIFSLLLSSLIIKSLNNFKEGLVTFFKYLNRETNKVVMLDDNSEDEFGTMAKVVNKNIKATQKAIEKERELIDESVIVMSEFESGDLCQRIYGSSNNPVLNELKDVINKMGNTMESNIDNILNVLEHYSHYDYIHKVDEKGLKEHLLKLALGVNVLGDSITGMLVENKTNGLLLDDSSDILVVNMNTLNTNSNETAAALEETAAALEEITSTIISNTETIFKISSYASELKTSANEGESLAKDTTQSMDEINVQVNAINDAISVIDQIAFQTNILSLNAAVEAATAGEAGKGFAVVAQEVRNLASRSAEAAKEIKELVENATQKANNGKVISSKMIDGYATLNQNISKTTELITDLESSSKEQQIGVEQINDAITQVDQQTQNNASISSNTLKVAVETDTIAKLVVSSTNEKNFLGKDTIIIKKISS